MTMKQIGGSKLQNNTAYLQKWINGKNPGPLVVEASVTHCCNHNCIHCSYQQYVKYDRGSSSINSDAFKKFLEDFKAMGGIEVYFAGNGEPLLNKLLPDFICYGYHIGLDITLSTNGVLLTEKVSDKILPCVKWIKFSINGGDRQSYAKVHRCNEGDFDKVIDNIKYILAYRKINNLDVKIIIHFLVLNDNINSLPAIVEISNMLNIDLLIIRKPVFDNNQNLNFSEDDIKYIKGLEDKENIIVRWDPFLNEDSCPPWDRCYGINFRTNLDEKGNLYTCFRNFFDNTVYGNITDNSFLNIWHSKRKKDIFSFVETCEDIHKCAKWCQSSYDNMFINTYLKNLRK